MKKIKNWISTLLQKIFEISSQSTVAVSVREIRTDIFASQILTSLPGAYAPWTMPALRPGALATILNDIVINQRRVIVECGGGVSTIYIARLLKQRGSGHLYTIEHDAQWIEILREQIQDEAEFVTLIHAPMQPLTRIRQGMWYSEAAVKEALCQIKIDLLIVDGPNETLEDSEIRYPALPILKDFFSENYAVLLDDVSRKGERAILAAWQKQVNLKFHIVSGAAIGLQSSAYKSYIA